MAEWEIEGKPALIIIHMQKGTLGEDTPVAKLGHGKAARESGIIPRQQELIRAFREKGLPIFFVSAYTPLDARFPALGPFWKVIKVPGFLAPGSEGLDVIPELDARPGEVLTNWPFGLFSNNDLHKRLEELNVRTLVLAGVATGTAVSMGAWTAADAFYSVVIPSDASTDAKRELHDVIMQKILPSIAVVTTTQDVLAHLQEASAGLRQGAKSGTN